MALGIAISVSNSIAVIEGFVGARGTFVRTPKTGAGHIASTQVLNYHGRSGWLPWLELGLAVHSAGAVAGAITLGVWGSIPFLILFPAGFFAVSLGSILPAQIFRPKS